MDNQLETNPILLTEMVMLRHPNRNSHNVTNCINKIINALKRKRISTSEFDQLFDSLLCHTPYQKILLDKLKDYESEVLLDEYHQYKPEEPFEVPLAAVVVPQVTAQVVSVAADWLPTNIYVFHDGEMCPLPRKISVRDAEGKVIRSKSEGEIGFGNVYQTVIRSALGCFCSKEYVEDVNINTIPITYHFVLQQRSQQSPQPNGANSQLDYLQPCQAVLTAMQLFQVQHHKLDSSLSSAAVESKLVDLLSSTTSTITSNFTPEARQKTLYIIISGGRDYSEQLRTALESNVKVVNIYSPSAALPPSLKNVLSLTYRLGTWDKIVKDSRLPHEAQEKATKKLADGVVKESKGHKKVSPSSGAAGAVGEGSRAKSNANAATPFAGAVRCDSYPKAIFASRLGKQAFKEAVAAVDSNLDVRCLLSEQKGNWIFPVLIDDEKKEISPEVLQKAQAALQSVFLTIVQDKALELKGVSVEDLKNDERIRNLARASNIMTFVPDKRPAPASQAPVSQSAGGISDGSEGSIILEHPNWDRKHIYNFLTVTLHLGLSKSFLEEDLKVAPVSASTSAVPCKEGCVRHVIKLFASDVGDPKQGIDEQYNRCMSFCSKKVAFLRNDSPAATLTKNQHDEDIFAIVEHPKNWTKEALLSFWHKEIKIPFDYNYHNQQSSVLQHKQHDQWNCRAGNVRSRVKLFVSAHNTLASLKNKCYHFHHDLVCFVRPEDLIAPRPLPAVAAVGAAVGAAAAAAAGGEVPSSEEWVAEPAAESTVILIYFRSYQDQARVLADVIQSRQRVTATTHILSLGKIRLCKANKEYIFNTVRLAAGVGAGGSGEGGGFVITDIWPDVQNVSPMVATAADPVKFATIKIECHPKDYETITHAWDNVMSNIQIKNIDIGSSKMNRLGLLAGLDILATKLMKQQASGRQAGRKSNRSEFGSKQRPKPDRRQLSQPIPASVSGETLNTETSAGGAADGDDGNEEDSADDDVSIAAVDGSDDDAVAISCNWIISIERRFFPNSAGFRIKARIFSFPSNEGSASEEAAVGAAAAETDDEIKTIASSLQSVVDEYKEETCRADNIRRSYKWDDKMLKYIFGLYFVFGNDPACKVLCGPKDAVSSAVQFLTTEPPEDRIEALPVKAVHRSFTWLLTNCRKHQAFFKELKQKCDSFTVLGGNEMQMDDPLAVFYVRGPSTKIKKCISVVEKLLRKWIANFQVLPLVDRPTKQIKKFLHSEAKEAIRRMNHELGVLVVHADKALRDLLGSGEAIRDIKTNAANPSCKVIGNGDGNDAVERATITDSSSGAGQDSQRPPNELLHIYLGGLELSVQCGTIFETACDVVVNAANGHMRHLAGIAKVIADKAGPALDDECQQLIRQYNSTHKASAASLTALPVGTAIATCSHRLRDEYQHIRHVVHAVGPRFDERGASSGEAVEVLGVAVDVDVCQLFQQTIVSALTSADASCSARRVAIPLIGAGIYRWPASVAAELTVRGVAQWVARRPPSSTIDAIVLVDVNKTHAEAFRAVVLRYQGLGSISVPSPLPEPMPVPVDARPVDERGQGQDHGQRQGQGQPQSRAVPVAFHLQRPKFVWYWEEHEKGCWTAYNYQQTLLLEAAMEADRFPVTFYDENSPSGEPAIPKYVVERSNCQSKFPPRAQYEYLQMNCASRFCRPVKCVPFEDGMTINGYIEAKAEPMESAIVSEAGDSDEAINKQLNKKIGSVTLLVTAVKSAQRKVTESAKEEAAVAATVPSLSAARAPVVPVVPANNTLVVIGFADAVVKARTRMKDIIERSTITSKHDLSMTLTTPSEQLREQLQDLFDTESIYAAFEILDNSNLPTDSVASPPQLGQEKRVLQMTVIGERAHMTAVRILSEFLISYLANKPQQEAAIEWPPEWPQGVVYDHSKPSAELVDVSPGSDEWRRVEAEFKGPPRSEAAVAMAAVDAAAGTSASSKKYKHFMVDIMNIQRVQNPSAWAAYYYKVKMLAARNTTGPAANSGNWSIFARANEWWMKHGTSATDPRLIYEGEQGLDSRYSPGGFFGRGAYTADDADYAHRYHYRLPTTKADVNPEHSASAPASSASSPSSSSSSSAALCQLFLVRVAAGRIHDIVKRTEEHRGWIHPPAGHDSVRGDVFVNNPAIVVYQPDHTYPAYLITYKSPDSDSSSAAVVKK